MQINSSLIVTCWASGGIRTPDQLITNQLLWPTELHWHSFKYPNYYILKPQFLFENSAAKNFLLNRII